jgi:iron complex outermembrane receptor protein
MACAFDGLAAFSSVDESAQGDANLGFGAGPFALRLSASARDTDPYETPIGEALNQWTSVRTYGIGGSLLGDWGYCRARGEEHARRIRLVARRSVRARRSHRDWSRRGLNRAATSVSIWGPFDRLDYGVQQSDYHAHGVRRRGEAGHGVHQRRLGRPALNCTMAASVTDGAFGLQFSNVDFEALGEEAFITATTTQESGMFFVERYDLGSWGVEGGASL